MERLAFGQQAKIWICWNENTRCGALCMFHNGNFTLHQYRRRRCSFNQNAWKAIWATIVPVWQSTAAYLSRKEMVSQTYRIVVLLLLPLQPFHRFSLLLLDARHSKLHELNFNKINNEIQQTRIGLSYILVNPTILKQDTSVRKIASVSSHLYTKKAAFERRNF